MNRAQRRNNNLTLTSTDITRILNEERREGMKHAVRGMSAAVGLMLKDKFDFTPEQLQKAFKELSVLFVYMKEGRLDLNDIEDTLREECGIDIREEIK